MTKRETIYRYISLLVVVLTAMVVRAQSIVGHVIDKQTNHPLSGCPVYMTEGQDCTLQRVIYAITDENGYFSLLVKDDKTYKVFASYLGYQSEVVEVRASDKPVSIFVNISDIKLDEVVVTAAENKGVVTSSKITREHMNHVQPSSLTDLMSLLPGGMTTDPSLNKVNSIRLRETGYVNANGVVGNSSGSEMSSLGTLFVVDGAPMNEDANQQYYSPNNDANADRVSTGRGVDMRNISTDDIESVEVVRGIPSAEYGNLTSGMVEVKRIRRKTPLTARLKADMSGKLLSAGKGWELYKEGPVVNANVSYLHSNNDPRNPLESFNRYTLGGRMSYFHSGNRLSIDWKPGVDVTITQDNDKTDPQVNYGRVNSFKSEYRRVAVVNSMLFGLLESRCVKSLSVDMSMSYQHDVIERQRFVSKEQVTLAPSMIDEGESSVNYLENNYLAWYKCDGKPLAFYAKAKMRTSTWRPIDLSHLWMQAGVEWNYSKNVGDGRQYDLAHPISTPCNYRPMKYSSIPGVGVMSSFVEMDISYPLGGVALGGKVGVRQQSLLGLDKAYALSGKCYVDPRMNVSLSYVISNRVKVTLTGGYGKTTKLPTQSKLYPERVKFELVQLNYYNVQEVGNSLVSVRNYNVDVANYGLKAARNDKKELRLDLDVCRHRLSVTGFVEKMKSGFSNETMYMPLEFKEYDASGIDKQSASRPNIESLPYVNVVELVHFQQAVNNTQIEKKGVEFQYTSARIEPIRTAIVVNGAWYKSLYRNSGAWYDADNSVVDGKSVGNYYVGYFEGIRGRRCEQFNTNFMFDTQASSLGLVFTATLENMWYVKTRELWMSGIPSKYLSTDGTLHEYTEESGKDMLLQHLTFKYSPEKFRQYKIARATYVNLKVAKDLGSHCRLSVFVNRMLDSTPDYKVDGRTIRRQVEPYFGMEANIKI